MSYYFIFDEVHEWRLAGLGEEEEEIEFNPIMVPEEAPIVTPEKEPSRELEPV